MMRRLSTVTRTTGSTSISTTGTYWTSSIESSTLTYTSTDLVTPSNDSSSTGTTIETNDPRNSLPYKNQHRISEIIEGTNVGTTSTALTGNTEHEQILQSTIGASYATQNTKSSPISQSTYLPRFRRYIQNEDLPPAQRANPPQQYNLHADLPSEQNPQRQDSPPAQRYTQRRESPPPQRHTQRRESPSAQRHTQRRDSPPPQRHTQHRESPSAQLHTLRRDSPPPKRHTQRLDSPPAQRHTQRQDSPPTQRRDTSLPAQRYAQRQDSSPAQRHTQRLDSPPTQRYTQRQDSPPTQRRDTSLPTQRRDTSLPTQRGDTTLPTQRFAQRQDSPPAQRNTQHRDSLPAQRYAQRQDSPPAQRHTQHRDSFPAQRYAQRQDSTPTQSYAHPPPTQINVHGVPPAAQRTTQNFNPPPSLRTAHNTNKEGSQSLVRFADSKTHDLTSKPSFSRSLTRVASSAVQFIKSSVSMIKQKVEYLVITVVGEDGCEPKHCRRFVFFSAIFLLMSGLWAAFQWIDDYTGLYYLGEVHWPTYFRPKVPLIGNKISVGIACFQALFSFVCLMVGTFVLPEKLLHWYLKLTPWFLIQPFGVLIYFMLYYGKITKAETELVLKNEIHIFNPISKEKVQEWSNVQKRYKCCGTKSWRDWVRENEFEEEKVPRSCCINETIISPIPSSNNEIPVLGARGTCPWYPDDYNTFSKGCLIPVFKMHHFAIGSILSAVLFSIISTYFTVFAVSWYYEKLKQESQSDYTHSCGRMCTECLLPCVPYKCQSGPTKSNKMRIVKEKVASEKASASSDDSDSSNTTEVAWKSRDPKIHPI